MQFITSAVALASVLLSITGGALSTPVLETRQLEGGSTENGLTDGSACKAVTVIFARGTTEAGNVGSLAGPQLFSSLRSSLGTGAVAVQGVAYPADIAGFLAGGDAGGSQTMANLVQQAATQCPSTKIVMSGYSQGGQLVHKAAALLSTTTAARVNAVVIFGDPDNGQALRNIPASRVLTICHIGDNICAGGFLILTPHLTYGGDAARAAQFIRSQVGL